MKTKPGSFSQVSVRGVKSYMVFGANKRKNLTRLCFCNLVYTKMLMKLKMYIEYRIHMWSLIRSTAD